MLNAWRIAGSQDKQGLKEPKAAECHWASWKPQERPLLFPILVLMGACLKLADKASVRQTRDAARTPPKRGCATHIFKARLARVYVGMRDPDIDIENFGVNELIDKKIEVIDFLPEISAKIRQSLKLFKVANFSDRMIFVCT